MTASPGGRAVPRPGEGGAGGVGAGGSGGAGAAGAGVAVPTDPAQREIALVDEAMAVARRGVPAAGGAPAVPGEDEVAGLEQAHDALRATLDRVDRGG